MNKNQKKKMEEYLDERWEIFKSDERKPDLIFYEGILSAVEKLGYTWERLKNGKHIIY